MSNDILSDILSSISTDNKASPQNQPLSDVEKCRYSLVEFVKTYLSTSGDELDELCSFHYEIAERLQNIVLSKEKRSTDTCIMAPRGMGKSFWTSYAFPLWCIAYKHTKNILIVTNEGSLSRQFIIDIRLFIEDSEKFREDFGDLSGDVIWNSEKLACANGVCCSAKSTGASLRGVKMLGVRPTVIIGDDLLNQENSGTKEQQNKVYSWYTKVLIKCGSKYCHTFIIGTPLADGDLISLLFYSEQFSDYFTKKYQAIIRYSDSELWNTWAKLRNDLSNPKRSEDADAFYFEHKEEMTKNTQVLWDRYDDTYLVLMKEKQRLGVEAWSSEMMCEALDESSREFPEDWIQRNIYLPEELPEITDVFIGIDAAAKGKMTSDDSAIVVVGKGSNNFLYLLETFSKKVPIDTLVDQLLLYAIQYYSKIRRIAIEDVVFQILLKDIMEKKAIDSGLYLPFEGIKVQTQGKKEFKLRSLVVPVRNGYFKFRKDMHKLFDEMRRFPKGKSDNLMDAWWISTYGVIGGTVGSKLCFESLSLGSHRNSNSGFNINSLMNRRRW